MIKYLPLVLLMVLIVPAFWALLRPGFFPMQDDLQAFRVHQMVACFRDLQIPCRWIPDAGYQYGYPQFNYYPPSVYYLGALVHLTGVQIIDSVKILFVLGYILSALTMFLLVRTLFSSDWLGLMGGLLYTYIPYKALEVYVRGALNEFWALVFFPLIFWAIYQLIKTEKLMYLIWTALFVGLLLITHNLMSLIFLPLAGVWALIWMYIERRRGTWGRLGVAVLLGVGLSAFYLLPVIGERQYAHLETLVGGYFDWRAHFVDLNQLVVSNNWGYGSSYLGPGDEISLSTGQIQFALALVGLGFSAIIYKKHLRWAIVYWVLFASEIMIMFLTHQRSSFIWERVKLMEYLQFPWRFLADSIFLVSLLSVIGLYFVDLAIPKKFGRFKWSTEFGAVTVILVLLLYGSFFQPREWFNLTDTEKFSGTLWEKQLTISIFDYLPIYAKLPPTKKAPDKPEVLEGRSEFLSYQKGSNWQMGEVEVGQEALLRAPLFDFPGMQVRVDNQLVDHWHDDCKGQEFCLGLVTFKVAKGRHQLELRLTDTPIRTAGNAITLGSLGVLGYLAFRSLKTTNV